MVFKIITAFLLSWILFSGVWAQPSAKVIDLKPQWQQYDANRKAYVPFDLAVANEALYFLVDGNRYREQQLVIESLHECNVFVNTQLFFTGRSLQVKVDSLVTTFRSPLLTVAIVKPQVGVGLYTSVHPLSPENKDSAVATLRAAPLRNFAVVGVLILLTMLVVLIRLNPKLASDYFSVTRVFSNRESNDIQVQSRISNSTNILFYIFCSLLIGFCLLLVFNFVSSYYPVALTFIAEDFSSVFFNWIKVSSMVLVVFFAKILLIYGLSTVFNVQGVTGMYFFNWIRVLLLTTGAVAMVLFVYFIRFGNNELFFRTLFEILPWVLGAWIVLIALKLRQKLNASLFHLFSYICATELIPFLITIKVLFS